MEKEIDNSILSCRYEDAARSLGTDKWKSKSLHPMWYENSRAAVISNMRSTSKDCVLGLVIKVFLPLQLHEACLNNEQKV